MTISMYTASIPVLVHELGILAHVLKKGEENATTRKIDPSVFVQARLAPDMFPLARQVQIATDVAKGGAARLAGVEIPRYEDTETTFEQLQERIAKTVAFLKGFKAGQIDGSETRPIELKVGGRDLKFTGEQYLLSFVLPNVFFHLMAAYAILRHNGVPLGKGDYLTGTNG